MTDYGDSIRLKPVYQDEQPSFQLPVMTGFGKFQNYKISMAALVYNPRASGNQPTHRLLIELYEPDTRETTAASITLWTKDGNYGPQLSGDWQGHWVNGSVTQKEDAINIKFTPKQQQ